MSIMLCASGDGCALTKSLIDNCLTKRLACFLTVSPSCLKPGLFWMACGAAEVAPFQNMTRSGIFSQPVFGRLGDPFSTCLTTDRAATIRPKRTTEKVLLQA